MADLKYRNLFFMKQHSHHILLILCLGMVFGFFASILQAQTSEPVASEAIVEVDKSKQEQSRQELRLMLWLSIIVLTLFVLFVAILSFFRWRRAVRHSLNVGKKNEPTEVTDLWSKYRIDEKEIDAFFEDEKGS